MTDESSTLKQFGVAQQLQRRFSTFSNFALSFSIISVLTGAVSLYGHGLAYGGPLAMTVGWPVVSLFTLSIALSLAELASAYPTAGALYHWATEETRDAARAAPRGLLLSVVISALVGWAMVLAVTLAVTDLEATIEAKSAFLFVLHERLGSIGDALTWMCAGAMWFCGLGSVTSNSRMLFAFARDGGLPFSAQLATVSTRHHVPQVAIWVSVAAAALVTLAGDAFAVMAALSTVALYVSYALPVAACLWRRKDGYRPPGPFSLGRWGPLMNAIALLWVVFMGVAMSVPPNGLAGLTMLSCLALLGAVWVLRAHATFLPPWVVDSLRFLK